MSNKKWATLLGVKKKPRKFYRFMRNLKRKQAEGGEFAVHHNVFSKPCATPVSNIPQVDLCMDSKYVSIPIK